MVDLTSCSPPVAQAIRQARAEILKSPRAAHAWGRMGMILVAHQLEGEANICFERAARLDPHEFRWPYLLGLNLSATDREVAVPYLERAVRLRGDVGVAHNRLGELLLDLGRHDQAEVHLRAAQRPGPSEVRPPLALARLAYLRGELREALQWADRAVRLAPAERATHELAAMIHQRLGDCESAAREHLRVSVRLAPHDRLAQQLFRQASEGARQTPTQRLRNESFGWGRNGLARGRPELNLRLTLARSGKKGETPQTSLMRHGPGKSGPRRRYPLRAPRSSTQNPFLPSRERSITGIFLPTMGSLATALVNVVEV